MESRPHYRSRPYEMRGERGRFGHSSRNNRSRGGRNTSSMPKFIKVSADEKSLVYSQLGTDDFGDPLLADTVFNSLKLVGQYSEDSEFKFVNDRSYISFLLTKYLPDSGGKEKPINLDLNVPDNEIEHYSGSGKQILGNILTWIINNKETFQEEIKINFQDPVSSEGGQFVTTKKVLAKFVAIPYRYGLEETFHAVSINGVIYLRRESEVSKDNISMWAHKFEQCLTRENSSKSVICNEDFRAVLSCTLGPHKLLYSTSVDCANPEEFEEGFTDLSAFIDLHCSEEATPLRIRYLMVHWYMNYILCGVPKVLLGQRNQDGVVKTLQLYEASEMLQLGKELWNPVTCLVFTSKLLSFIKSKVESDPGSVFCIRKEHRKAEITCTKVPEFGNFLPEWYLEEMHSPNPVHE